jgi:hypothetical protein
MSMVRGKVRVGDLVQTGVQKGSKTELRFERGKVVDGSGRTVETRPLKELVTTTKKGK